MQAIDGTPRADAARLSGRWAIAAIAAQIAVMFMGSTLLTPLYVLYEQRFNFSDVTLTLVYAVYAVGNIVALLFLGRLSDQIGRRRTSLPAMAVAGVSVMLFLLAESPAWLFWGRMLSGFAIGLASAASTAWLAELYADRDKSRATLAATTANFGGLCLAPILAGVLAEYAAWPLQLSYVAYLVMLAAVAVLVWRTAETVARPVSRIGEVALRPRLGIPPAIRRPFVAPAVTAFGCFALVGFYAALAPSLLLHSLHESNLAIGGAVVFELFLVATIAVIATRRLDSATAMRSGLLLLLPSLGCLVLAQILGSLPVLLAGTALSGLSAALGYRGSLQVVNQIAPAERRAEVVASYFVICFSGNSVPVIGVGVISHLSGALAASETFAVTIAVLALVALFTSTRYAPRR